MHCSKCGAEAKLENEVLVRSCECDASVIADMESNLEGQGGIST